MSTPTNMLVIEGQKLEPCGPAGAGDSSVKVLNTVANCGAATAPLSKPESVSGPAPVLTGHGHQPISTTATVAAPGPQTSSPSVVVVAATPGGSTSTGQLQVTTPALSQLASVKQTATPGRTVVITVPRTAAPQPVAVAPRPHQTPSSQLPGHIQIPPGMMLIRSDSGQLMLVYQQALAQAPQGPRIVSGQAPRILAHQVSAAAGSKSNEKVTVIRMTPPPSFQSPPVQKTAVVKVIGVAPKPAVVQTPSALSEQENQPHILAAATQTKKEPQTIFSPETLESVKKCKNFLVTLIKLASSGSRSANMANNVRGLVRSLLEGKLEAEEFTEQLYHELKSTPQPCLVPFLKKSLPAVRRLTADPQLFIQQASTSSNKPNTQSSAVKQSLSDRGQNMKNSQQICQQPRQVILRPALTTLAQSRNYLSKSSRPSPKPTVLQSGSFPVKHPLAKDPPHSTKFGLKHSSGSYKEDDDINDVAFMAGVNLREENAQILTSVVGSVVQSCQDQPFLAPNSVLSRILHTGQALEVTDVSPEVVALVSHATQEYLRELLEKLTAIAELRKAALKEDLCYVKVSDVRSQLRFLEEVETLQKKKKDEEEREKMLRLARSRSHTEDPQHQQLKQRAKELQQMEEAELQQREANLTALAAIGPRRKRPLELTESQVPLLSRPGVNRVTRVMLKDLLVCMEQDPFLRHSLTLYKAML